MRISLQGAAATRLDIDVSVDGEVRRVSLSGLHAVVGELERGKRAARLRPLRADAVVLDALEWPLPGGGRVSVTSPAALADLVIELDAADGGTDSNPLSGWVSAGRAEVDAVAVDLAGGARVAFDAELRRARIEHSPERNGQAAADQVEVGNLQAVLGGLLCRLSAAILDRARVDWQAGKFLIAAAAGRATGISIAVPGSGLTIEIDRAELPAGIISRDGALVIPELVVPEVRIAVDDLVELFRRPAPPAETDGSAGEPGGSAGEPGGSTAEADASAAQAGTAAPESGQQHSPFDYGFLDRVTGRFDVDMTLDISLPVIGGREATHNFRVPIAGGVINYRELERDLANLEDAFIDVEVRGQSLVIERAIPLIPGLEKPLVVWDLTEEELELARRRLVRLRTIPRLRLVEHGERTEKSSVALRSLRFDDIDIAIALDPPPPGESDSIARASAAELRATGWLVFEPAGPTLPDVTSVHVSGTNLAAGPFALAAPGGARIEVESIELGQLADGTADFAGFRPRAASFVARDLRVLNLRLFLPA